MPHIKCPGILHAADLQHWRKPSIWGKQQLTRSLQWHGISSLTLFLYLKEKKSFEVKSEHKGNGRSKKANSNEMGIEDYKGQRAS